MLPPKGVAVGNVEELVLRSWGLPRPDGIPQKPNIDLRLLCGSRFLNVGTKKEMRDFLKLAELGLYVTRAQ